MSEFNEGMETKQEPAFDIEQANKGAEERKSELASQTLTWGILGLAFAFAFPYVGIPFSRKGLRLGDEFIRTYGESDARAKVGRILAKIGSIVSIVFAILYPFYLAYCFCIGFMGAL